VPPAWLLSRGAWAALRAQAAAFEYTTTRTRFHLLAGDRALKLPAVVYSARSAPRIAGSLVRAEFLSLATGGDTALRISLHPGDADHPMLVRQAAQLIAGLAA